MAEYSNLFVVLMGIGVVFFGLTCIVILTIIMGKIIRIIESSKAVMEAPTKDRTDKIEKIKPEIIAIITSVISEEIDISANELNIVDIHKL